MHAILSVVLGYVIGCISPAAWLSKKKHVDLKKEGTGNLGATNTGLVLGKKAGIFVLIFDIAKSFFSYKLARFLFSSLAVAGILASIGTILGHCFPITMGFRGGKGLAAFGGMILAYRTWMFFAIIFTGIALMLITDVGVTAPMAGCILFPVFVYMVGGSMEELCLVLLTSLLVVFLHRENLKLAFAHKDVVGTRDYIRKVFGSK